MYVRLAIDAFLQKGMFFFGASVEQDEGASLPYKLLMFGFSFFILISVSSYVANLAAFLTLSGVSDYINTMEKAVAYKTKICGHSVLRDELQLRWPDANFVFPESGSSKYGVFDLYDAGKCDVMAVQREDTTLDEKLMEMYCERDLVFTDVLVIETPMAFPISSDIAAGFSYWLYQGEKYHDISLPNVKRGYSLSLACDVELSAEKESAHDYAQIAIQNMFFPLTIFAAFTSTAIVLQLIHQNKEIRKKSSSNVFGRVSILYSDKSEREVVTVSRSVPMVTMDDRKREAVKEKNVIGCETKEATADEIVKTDAKISATTSKRVAFAMECAPIFPDNNRLQRVLDDFIDFLLEVKQKME